MNAILEMAANSTDLSIRYFADATIRKYGQDKAAREVVTLLAIQCPTNSPGARKLMSALIYLFQTGR